jgi:hypothetical protein
VDEGEKFEVTFSYLIESDNPADWIRLLMQFHNQNQKRKSEYGKRPWIEQVTGDCYMIHSRYKMDKKPEISDEYVSFYRTKTLWSFLKDLKKVRYDERD